MCIRGTYDRRHTRCASYSASLETPSSKIIRSTGRTTAAGSIDTTWDLAVLE